MELRYVVVGVSVVIFGAVMVIRPRTVARWRNAGARNPEPTAGLVKLTRYFGGPSLIALGAILLRSTI